MVFSDLEQYTSVSLEGAGVFLIIIIAYKLYKMKIHSKSGCCGEHFILETMNRGTSRSDLEFTDMKKDNKDNDDKDDTAII
tara:strand:- start:58 stop:300 length:243 start_codon:yes stop_codon:yes gene_type:complete